RFGQQGQHRRLALFRSRSPTGSEPLTYLDNPSLLITLHDQRPALRNSSPRQPERQPLLGRQSNQCLCVFPRFLMLPTVDVDPSSSEGGTPHSVSMRQFSGQGQGLAELLQRLVWITKQEEALTIKIKGAYCWILAVHEGLRAPLLRVIPGHTVLAIGFGGKTLPKAEGDLSQPSVGPHQKRGVG